MIKTTAHADDRNEISALVAENLRKRMEAERWTGRSLALALGLQPVYVQRRASGEVEMSATDMKVFGDHIGMQVQDFYVPAEPKDPRPGNGARLRSLYLIDGLGNGLKPNATELKHTGLDAGTVTLATVTPITRKATAS